MINITDVNKYKGISGIYFILEVSSKRIYVGSSVDIRRRVRNHATDLLSGNHKNEYLQRVWNKGVPSCFLVGVLELVENKSSLLKREQFWMDLFKSYDRNKGFNLTPTAGSNLGFKKSKEQIENNIKAIQGKRKTILKPEMIPDIKIRINNGEPLGNIAEDYGCSYETISSIRKNRSFKYINPQIKENLNKSRKLKEEDVVFIKEQLNKGVTVKQLSERYLVSHRTISAIKNEITWKNVGEKITIKKRKSRMKGD